MMTYLLQQHCSHCGTPNYDTVGKCRGCGKKLDVKLPGPKVITDTGRFGL